MNKKELNVEEMNQVNGGNGTGAYECPNCGSHDYRHNPASGISDYDFICNNCDTYF